MTKKTIEIFRAGAHVGMDGKTYTFSDADVQAIALAYSPAIFAAPVVVGHPKTDAPAYGWTDALSVREDGIVVADIDQLDPAFAETVEAGRYRKVSASFYPPAAANNPTPGQYYLRHIGFLGAAAPGVTGLKPVEFAQGDEDYVEFAVDAAPIGPVVWLARLVGRVVRRQREQAIAEVGVDKANEMFPEWDVDAPAEIVAELERARDDASPRFAEPDPAAETETDPADPAAGLAAREASLAEREAAFAAREQAQVAAFAESQRQARVAEDDAFLEGLIEEGRLPPGLKLQMAGFCEALGESEAISFAEGEAAVDPRVRFKALLSEGLGKVIRFDEVAGGEGVQFAEGETADQLAERARQAQADARARGETLSASAAMAAVTGASRR